jgi:hypothetical protein
MLSGLARDLTQVVSEPIFDVPRLVEAARHQLFDPILGSGSAERSDARIPPGVEFDVRRQAGVDEVATPQVPTLSVWQSRVECRSSPASSGSVDFEASSARK